MWYREDIGQTLLFDPYPRLRYVPPLTFRNYNHHKDKSMQLAREGVAHKIGSTVLKAHSCVDEVRSVVLEY